MCVLSAAFNWREAASLEKRPATAAEGCALVHFMLNSVSISWLLPSLQQKSRERNACPQKSSGFDRRSVQSFIPEPGATEHCQQTFHWNHIKPLLFPHFCPLPALPLTLPFSLCLFILHVSLPSASSLYVLLPTFTFLSFFPLTLRPVGFLGLFSRDFSTFFKLFLPSQDLAAEWQFVKLLPIRTSFAPDLAGCQVVVRTKDEQQIFLKHRNLNMVHCKSIHTVWSFCFSLLQTALDFIWIFCDRPPKNRAYLWSGRKKMDFKGFHQCSNKSIETPFVVTVACPVGYMDIKRVNLLPYFLENRSSSVKLDEEYLWTSISRSYVTLSVGQKSRLWLDHLNTFSCVHPLFLRDDIFSLLF